MSVRGIPYRLGLALTIVIGVGCAVGVLVAMLAMGVGARREALGNARADRVILMTPGAQGGFQSSISKDVMPVIGDLPGVRRNAKGDPIAVAEVFIFVQAHQKGAGNPIGFPIVGVTAALNDLMPELHLTAGRMFQPGLHELVASNVCTRKFLGFKVGEKRAMRGGEWSIVGNFDVGRSVGTCLVFADAETVLSAFGRSSYNVVAVMLQSAGAVEQLKGGITANPTLKIEAKRETELTERDLKDFNGMLNFVSYLVGGIMAIAATLGAANSLYAIVEGRRRELATLRAIGFKGSAIVAAVLSESILLALPGAVIGAAVAWLFFNGFTASPFGFSFRLAVTFPIVAVGIGWALAMGFVGGLLPGLRAARMPVTTALRAT
jgi:putative ABC transport system permease protein